jgi:general secretion pathway protein F
MQYLVKALRGFGGIEGLTVDALDVEEARCQVERMGYRVLALKPKRAWAGISFSRAQAFPLVLFSQELVALLGAGLSLMEALETLAEKERRPDLNRILQDILTKLREGRSLSAALQHFPMSFTPLYIATVRASERTGDLGEALTRFITYQSQLDGVRKKLVNASIYPLVLMATGGLVMAFLLLYVVPKFSRVYEDVRGNLPFLSQLLLQWGKLLEAHGSEVLMGGALAVTGSIFGITRPSVKGWIVDRLWSVPSLGNRLRVYELARFYRTLGMLLRGGTPIVQAFGMASGLLPPMLRSQLARATGDIREGKSISHAMERHDLTTPVALRMLRVGERSGQMGEMMERIAAFYDEEIARWVEWLSRLIEPVLMAVIGLVIGTVVVLMYFPIFELAGSIQ